MSYESPITAVYEQIETQINQDFENRIMAEVKMKVDVNVDKDEIIKALNYDRRQYEKGYADAKKEYERPQGEWILFVNDIYRKVYRCSLCNRHIINLNGSDLLVAYPYCHCGARMEVKNDTKQS